MANLSPQEDFGQIQQFPRPSDESVKIALIQAAVKIIRYAVCYTGTDMTELSRSAAEFLKREFGVTRSTDPPSNDDTRSLRTGAGEVLASCELDPKIHGGR